MDKKTPDLPAVPSKPASSSSAAASPAVATESVRAEVGNIAAIEGLRGVAVLGVMAFHFVWVRDGKLDDTLVAFVKSWPPLDVLARNGDLGVDLFFAFLPLLFPRIWIEATSVVAVNLGAHITFLHYTNPLTSASMAVNGALWTLAIEVQYYLLLPLVAPLFVRWPQRSLAGAFVVAAGWRWLCAHHLDSLVAVYLSMVAHAGVDEAGIRNLLATQFPAWALHFALGILAGRAWMLRRGRLMGSAGQWASVFAAAATAAVLYGLLRGGTAFLGELAWMARPVVPAAVLAVVVVWPSTWLSSIAASRPLASLGRISYSAYLYHLPVLLLFNAFLPGIVGWIAFPLWFAVVAAVSTASYRLVEIPGISRRAA